MANLGRVGLADLAHQRASTLSGGQQQRVAIARALTQQAEVILADEPIASLDPESARKVMEILADINRQDGKTVVVTLHQVDYAVRYCPRAVALKGGRIHFDGSGAPDACVASTTPKNTITTFQELSMLNRFGRVFASAAVLAGCLMGTAQADDSAINFGIMSTESSQNLKSVWQPFLDDMSKKTGLKVNATFASDYAGLIQGMRFNKVDVAWLGNKAAMEAV
nr:ATP binding cassette (ABC) transporter, putative [Tanacetum cinerariifolium]